MTVEEKKPVRGHQSFVWNVRSPKSVFCCHYGSNLVRSGTINVLTITLLVWSFLCFRFSSFEKKKCWKLIIAVFHFFHCLPFFQLLFFCLNSCIYIITSTAFSTLYLLKAFFLRTFYLLLDFSFSFCSFLFCVCFSWFICFLSFMLQNYLT